MSALGRYIVDAIVLEHRSPTELARDHAISRSRIYQLLQRFGEGGYPALEPRSRRPHSCARKAGLDIETEVLRLRNELAAAGHDAGPQTILYYLQGRVAPIPSAATIWRILKRNGLVTPQPHKRPKSSFIRFEALLPNETWQLDSTPRQLADATPVEILNFLDDKSRLALASRSFLTGRRRRCSDHHRGRGADPGADARPDSELPTPRRPLACPQCLATGVRYVLRQDRCGPEGIRTPDLLNAIQTRSQLRHGPTATDASSYRAGLRRPSSRLRACLGRRCRFCPQNRRHLQASRPPDWARLYPFRGPCV